MNKVVTSQEEILIQSRLLIREKGIDAISIRNLAKACHVSVGSIYNYFSNKADLVSATIESIWEELFHTPDITSQSLDTVSYIKELFRQLEEGNKRYPNFMTLHALAFVQEDKNSETNKMHDAWHHIQTHLMSIIKNDPHKREDALKNQMHEKDFAQILFSLILSSMLRQDFNPKSIIKLIQDVLY